jgi:hypothetical protein
MKLTTLTAASFWATQAAGHYIWNQLDIGGTTGSIGQGIRPNSNYNSPVIGTNVLSNSEIHRSLTREQISHPVI